MSTAAELRITDNVITMICMVIGVERVARVLILRLPVTSSSKLFSISSDFEDSVRITCVIQNIILEMSELFGFSELLFCY